MKRKFQTLIILGIVVFAIQLAGCNQVANEPKSAVVPSLTPDTSIVWSDDFSDGNLDGWNILSTFSGDFYNEEDALKKGLPELGSQIPSLIEHSSPVISGSWSFDLYRIDSEDSYFGESCLIGLFSNISLEKEYKEYHEDSIYKWYQNPDLDSLVLNLDSETMYLTLLSEGKSIVIAQHPIVMDTWQHIDVIRDKGGRVLVYMDGEQIFDYTDDRFTESQVFFIGGSMWMEFIVDNIVVRDEVIEILPQSQ